MESRWSFSLSSSWKEKKDRLAAKNHQSKIALNAQAWILCFFLFMEGKERKSAAKISQVILLLIPKLGGCHIPDNAAEILLQIPTAQSGLNSSQPEVFFLQVGGQEFLERRIQVQKYSGLLHAVHSYFCPHYQVVIGN